MKSLTLFGPRPSPPHPDKSGLVCPEQSEMKQLQTRITAKPHANSVLSGANVATQMAGHCK